ncbi:MAG: GxxExxY protein [Patescibacteria group bacterium]
MFTNDTNHANKIIYPKLSYLIIGICFKIHNELGRYSREKQYGDALENRLKECDIFYKREFIVGSSGNIVDFIIDDKIILELKAKPIITKDDYYQIQRYLQIIDIKLGLLVNFRDTYLRPKRIVKIETPAKDKFT